MKYQVHIDRLVVERPLGAPQDPGGLSQQIARAVQQHLPGITPEDSVAEVRAGLASAIATALQQALRRGAR